MDANTPCVLVSNEHDLEALLKTKNRLFVLFYASWCPFCSRFLPIFEKYAQDQRLNFIMVMTDHDEDLAEKYSVDVVPTVLFCEHGMVSKRLDGLPGEGLDDKKMNEFITTCSLAKG